jgi:hypothetical protein
VRDRPAAAHSDRERTQTRPRIQGRVEGVGWVLDSSDARMTKRELGTSDRPWLAWSDAPGARRGWGRTLNGQYFATAEEGAEALGAAWRGES